MLKILVIGGTQDSADFLRELPAEIEATATVVSKLGARCLPVRSNLKVQIGRLDQAGFRELLADKAFLVDLSHPFAQEVSAQAQKAAILSQVPYLRYLRKSPLLDYANCRHFTSFEAAASALTEIEGNIFLTTGSKTLPIFQRLIPDFAQRCYLRVLASSQVLGELEALGIDPAHIFAMKGVASAKLNIALAQEIKATCLVSKNSGITGGLLAKLEAAKALNIPLYLIEPPPESGRVFRDFQEILAILDSGKLKEIT